MTVPGKSFFALRILLLSLIVSSLQAFAADEPPSAEVEAAPVDTRGAVLVMPEAGAEMPDIAEIIDQLQDIGLRPPGMQTEFMRAAKVFGVMSDGLQILPKSEAAQCFTQLGGSDKIEPKLSEILARAKQDILVTEYGAAAAKLREARDVLPCLSGVVPGEELFQLYLLKGVNAFFEGKPEDTLKYFENAVAIAPEHEWSQEYPPSIWEIFLKAKSRYTQQPRVLLRGHLLRPGKLMVDGSDIPAEGLSVAMGEHLVQLVSISTEKEAQVSNAWLLLSPIAQMNGSTWFTDAGSFDHRAALFDGESELHRRMLVDALVGWAVERQTDWLLLLDLKSEKNPARALFLDVQEAEFKRPPKWMGLGKAAEGVTVEVRTPRGKKEVHIPNSLKGWQAGIGLSRWQQFGDPNAGFLGLEIGGFRNLYGGLDARISLGFGLIGGTDSSFTIQSFQAIHVGVRKTWSMTPFGLFVDGGFLGCRCRTKLSTGLELHGGTFYRFGSEFVNAIELNVGVGAVPGDSLVVGQGSLHYQRAF